jgi:hypothetical protein
MAIRLPPKEGMVTTYRGVVKGNIVVIEGPVDLPDGAEVEVRPVARHENEANEGALEDAFERHLLEIGLIKRIPPRLPDPPGLDRTLLELEGPPLSEQLIEERR